jgi:hypothetical protein
MTADVGLSWRIEPTAAWWKIRGQGQLLFFFGDSQSHKVLNMVRFLGTLFLISDLQLAFF